MSLNEEVKVPAGTYKHCLKTEESSGLESATGQKRYAPEVGLLKDAEFELAKIERPLPDAVARTFKAEFPKGQISKLDIDVEDGVTVYDIEFTDGTVEKETDITADGTMLEFTVVVAAKSVPAAAMKAIKKGAGGAPLSRIENIKILYETKDGKAVKLAKPVTHFAAEYAADGKTAEIVVTAAGAPVMD